MDVKHTVSIKERPSYGKPSRAVVRVLWLAGIGLRRLWMNNPVMIILSDELL